MGTAGSSPRLITAVEWAAARRRSEAFVCERAAAGARLPDMLLGYQKRLMQTTAASRVVVCEKSRRIGMTWAVAADAVLTSAAARGAGGMDTLYIGYNLDMAREFVDASAMWARAFDHAATDVEEFLFDDGPDRAIAAFRVRFHSGFEIVALASRPRSLRSRQGYVIVDEAAFVDDLDGVMKAALALLIWGGRVLVLSTHFGADNAFNRLVTDIRAGRKPYALIRVTFDDALNDGLYERICLVAGAAWSPDEEAKWRADIIADYGDDADEELFCIPSQGGGVYLPRPLVEARMVAGSPVFRLSRPPAFAEMSREVRERDILAWCEETLKEPIAGLDLDCAHYFGEDFGRIADLTVIAPLAVQKNLKRIVPFVVEMRGVPFEQQKQVLFYVVDGLPRFVGGQMDATGNGAYLAEVAAQRYGAGRIAQVKLNPGWYLEHFPPLKAAFEDAAISIPQDAGLLDDLALVRMVAGVPQIPPARTKAGGGKTRHGDFAVALVLAYAATRASVAEYGYRAPVDAATRDGFMLPDDDDRRRDWWCAPRGTGLRGSV